MIDPITEQILLEAKIVDAIKKIAPSIERALLKRNAKAMKALSKKMPKKTLKQVEAEALKIPGFRVKYRDAQRAVARSKIIDKKIKHPASLAIGIGSAASGQNASDIVAHSEQHLRKTGLLTVLFPMLPLIKLGLIITIILTAYIGGMPAITGAAQALLKLASLLVALLGKVLSGTSDALGYMRGDHTLTPEQQATIKDFISDDDLD